MRIISTILTIGSLVGSGWWINNKYPDLKHNLIEMVSAETFQTLEVRFSANQIMDKARSSLIRDSQHKYGECALLFHPYLLLEVKYTNAQSQTDEGTILWDLVDGEMVLDTRNWSKTHGFADTINTHADHYEYTLIDCIAKNKGRANKQTIADYLQVDHKTFDLYVERALKKKLIVKHKEEYRLHIRRAKFHNGIPSTYISEPLVTKVSKKSERMPKRYSPAQIRRAAELAFWSSNFSIRASREVFLPIYSITVENPDGSIHTTFWNAVNSKRITHPNFIE